MLGGPNDGAVVTVNPIHAAITMPSPDLAAYTRNPDPARTHEAITTTAYALRDLMLWGRRLGVGVAPGMTDDEVDQAAIRHLLSPLARNLLEEP